MQRSISNVWQSIIGIKLFCVLAAACTIAGCERKEKVLEIETPGAKIEINKTGDGTEVTAPGVEIDVKSKKN